MGRGAGTAVPKGLEPGLPEKEEAGKRTRNNRGHPGKSPCSFQKEETWESTSTHAVSNSLTYSRIHSLPGTNFLTCPFVCFVSYKTGSLVAHTGLELAIWLKMIF